jgi:PadR family transcriptional regulator, regulatory protein PadR
LTSTCIEFNLPIDIYGRHMTKQPDTLQGTIDLLILKTLQRGANHGFGITLHIQTASEGVLRIEEGSLYPALHRLEREKLIQGRWKTTKNGRRARYYGLTKKGSERLSEAEESWAALMTSIGKVLRYV